MTDDYPVLGAENIFKLLSKRLDHTFLSLKDLPHPSKFKDMDKAVDRICRAIHEKEKIILIGDYDVDGVISTSVMKLFFEEIDYPLEYIVPNRFRDGYGLSTTLIPRISDYDLVITVDNGISAVEAARKCKELGVDLIITDHHIVPTDKPEAYAIINQKQDDCGFPYAEICGAQIAWYLCTALAKSLKADMDMRSYLELVCIAIVADIMPLSHINRAMVLSGIKLLNRSRRAFIKAYKNQNSKELLVSEDIAFSLAPLLNSAGRLEDASLAVDFVCSKNIYDAGVYLKRLQTLNSTRKTLEQRITDEALELADSSSRVVVVASDGWHEGVVGIVAARVARKLEKPAVVLSKSGNICKGSGRSFNGCDLFSLVQTQRGKLERFGGHSAAIGLSIKADMLKDFQNDLHIKAGSFCKQGEFIDPGILGILPFGEISFSLIEMIAQFEPFGEANPKPKFISFSVEVLAAQTMGREANHLRFTFREGNIVHNGVQFRTNEQYESGERVDIVYSINKNYFRGETTIQLLIDRISRT